jgi:flagellar biosynthesis/type III secretory pathway protein FliH
MNKFHKWQQNIARALDEKSLQDTLRRYGYLAKMIAYTTVDEDVIKFLWEQSYIESVIDPLLDTNQIIKDKAYKEGKTDGWGEGYDSGRADGYSDGYNDGEQVDKSEL